jgi:hypothetical protein
MNAKKRMIFARQAFALLIALVLVLASGASPARAGATVYKDQYEYSVAWYGWVECAAGGAGEEIFVTGTYRVTYRVVYDNHGGYHAKFQSVSKGLEGVGLTTGDKYQGKDVYQSEWNGKVGFENTVVNKFMLVGQGPGNNVVYHYTYHITINANGEVTAERGEGRYACK